MDINEIRLENARSLAKKLDPEYPIKALATKLDKATSLISNYIGKNPTKRIGNQVARDIELAFDLPRGWMDAYQGEIKGMMMVADQTSAYRLEGSPSTENFISIPRYRIFAECGTGYLNDHVEVDGGLAYRRDWLAGMGWDPAYLRVLYGKKDSMWPTISDGAVLLLYLKENNPVSGMIYLLNWFGEERIKRLFKDGNSAFRITSDNPNKALYPDEHIDFAKETGVSIIGRIVWQGGLL